LTNPFRRAIEHHRGFPIAPGSFPALGHFPAICLNGLAFIRETERRLGPLFWMGADLLGRQLS
jgi:hypothetical protein